MGSSILIGADIVPTESNYSLFINGDVDKLVGDSLLKVLNDADYIIMNLETPLSDCGNPIEKAGPCLCAPRATIAGLKRINPYFFTLANNHIMDYGPEGLFSTIELLESNGIAYAGVGRNVEEAQIYSCFT